MQTFHFKSELQEIISNKKLVEITLDGAPTYKVAYILAANDDYLTFAEVSSSASFSGVSMCRTKDINIISVDTIYLSELVKLIPGESLYLQALKNVENVTDFTPSGLITAVEGTKTLVELTTIDEEVIAGRIINHDDEIIVLDEYSSESDRRIAHSYYRVAHIIRISLDVPWVRTITRSLADKNL
jgi:hypothetical protein